MKTPLNAVGTGKSTSPASIAASEVKESPSTNQTQPRVILVSDNFQILVRARKPIMGNVAAKLGLFIKNGIEECLQDSDAEVIYIISVHPKGNNTILYTNGESGI